MACKMQIVPEALKMPREKFIKKIENFFFEGMLHGYISENPEIILIPGMPGFKGTIFENEEFRLLDCWLEAEKGKDSFGFTIIWLKQKPRDIVVWHMNYEGRYEPEAIPILKEVLRMAYERGDFRAGRGIGFSRRDIFYENSSQGNDFTNFKEIESITRYNSASSRIPLGFHKLSGGIVNI